MSTPLTRHYCRWTQEEDAALRWAVGNQSVVSTARALGRSPDATLRRGRRLGVNLGEAARHTAGMSMADVARAFGVHPLRVSTWRRLGWLRTHRSYIVRATVVTIDAYDVSAFLNERGALLPYLAPTEPAWQDEVNAARGSLQARYISRDEMFGALGWSRSGFIYIQRRLGFRAVPFLSIGSRYPRYYERSGLRHWLDEHPQYWTQSARRALASTAH